MSDADRALENLVKAQNALALQAWDVVRVQNSVKDADAHLSKCRTNLSDAHVKNMKCQREVETAMEEWRLSVLKEHCPFDSDSDPAGEQK